MSEYMKNWVDALFLAVTGATVAKLIPLLVGLLAIIWGIYRIIDIHLAIKLKRIRLQEELYGNKRLD